MGVVVAVLIIEDLVSRMWITEIVSVEETSTQVELAFTAALDTEGLLEAVDARHDDGRIDLATDEESRPILLAVTETTAHNDVRLNAGVPGLMRVRPTLRPTRHPTDQAGSSLNGHIKIDYPHLLAIRDHATLRADLAVSYRPRASDVRSGR